MNERPGPGGGNQAVFSGASSLSILIVFLIFFFLFREALPFFMQRGLQDFISLEWIPVSFQKPSYGLVPLFTGTFIVTFIAMCLAVGPGVLAAVYVAELAGRREQEILKPVLEILAGIPSVVIGFFGLVTLAPLIKGMFGLPSGLTALTGAILLALMALPTIVSISEDAIRSVPRSYRDASLALGASPMQTIWRAVVPAAAPGIFAAVMLGAGRVLGETMVVLMVTGNAYITTLNPFESVRTMTATVAAEMGEVAFGSMHYSALFAVGVILLLVTFVFNLVARRVLERYVRK